MSMRPRRTSEIGRLVVVKSPIGSSISLASKLLRQNRAKMAATSSASSSSSLPSSPQPQRLARLRRLTTTKNEPVGASVGGTGGGTNTPIKSASSPEKQSKSSKGQLLQLTPTQMMIRKLYERINRAHKASQRESVKQMWRENRENLDSIMKQHHRLQTQRASSISCSVVGADDIEEATMKIYSNRSTTSEKIKVLVVPEIADELCSLGVAQDGREYQCIPVTTLSHVSQIPPVLDWTAIPHNLHEDDGKFLTNIPFLGDEFIDKDAKFIDEMVTLYEGKVHEAKDSSSFKKMDDEVLYTLIQALMKIETDEGPNVFDDVAGIECQGEGDEKQEQERFEKVESGVTKDIDAKECEEDLQKTTFSAIAAKLLQSENESVEPGKPSETDDEPITVKAEIVEEENKEAEKVIRTSGTPEAMEVDSENSDQSTGLLVVPTKPVCKVARPSNTILSLISQTFKGLGTENEIRERYDNAEKVRGTPQLPILPNGMELHTSESYSIPNVEGPCAKYLPKEATMHAFRILFCRRCFIYDCKRHTGDDQVDVKYYKNNQTPSVPTSISASSFTTGFNFLCKNPDCWQMNDTVERTADEILREWTPGDRSLFLCFIESFPFNYCFVAYLMRNKTCLQVKEYANLENVPKMESCPSVSSRKPKHRKPRMGFNKKSCNPNNKRNVTRRWINNVKKTEKAKEEGGIKSGGKLPPRYMPCLHEKGGECDSSCTCRINKTSCEKFCTCALTCPYRFPGCRCTSTCDSKRCICFAAARECDPDLCLGCGANEDELEKISCHNVNIQRKLHKHLLMGRSDISGWGIYIKNDAQKGEFIAEYRGELISHDESERRGHVYDKIQHTFLFELNDHFVVDATRKGNKSRFVNSSKNPNCEVKRMLVNGDHRIGIYAKRYIEAGEELFYDYEDGNCNIN
ncbi:Histone-lysine N-methyltransferase E(z) [Orchesella cincta]|uniref:[histone H3]-lysine(27) N-trimethyltransferase n=1 Tax=Orchesella cincta TaxID=48709 RepID=A0A1D2MJD5_ORCCI|nr:Histone-lysine N-methyltransferase E(z) [Orchesella cincta]